MIYVYCEGEQMHKTFAGDKFFGNMKIAILSMIVTYSTSLLDYFLVGRAMGEEALQAFALLTPYLSIVFFVSCLISSGTAIMIAFEVGKGSRERGNLYFQQGVILALGVGILLSIALLLGGGWVLGNKSVPVDIRKMMNDYYLYICLLPVWHILNELLFSVIWNAGGDIYCVISLGVKLVINIAASVLLMSYIGIGGTGLGTIFGCICSLLVFPFYFRSKQNVFQWGWHFDIRSVFKMFHFSIRDAMIYLYMAAIQFLMNAYLMYRYGGQAVLIFSVIMNLENLYLTVFDSPGDAVSVILTVFVGEGNRRGILKSMKAAEKTAMIEGIVTMLILLIFSEQIPLIFGITGVENIHMIAVAVRIFAIGALVFPIIMLFSTYYLTIERVFLSVEMMTMQILVAPLVSGVLLSIPFGLTGVWIGLCMGSVVMLFIDALILKIRHSDRTFPYLLNKEKLKKQLSYDVPISQEGVMSLVNQVETDLTKRGIEQKKIYRIMLMIEETEMLVVERNRERGGIIQCDLFMEDPIRLVLRDSGLYSDITDQDGVAESFRAYTATMIGSNYGANQYLLTWGNNRTVCTF